MYKIIKLIESNTIYSFGIKTKDGGIYIMCDLEDIKKLDTILFLSGIKLESIEVESYLLSKNNNLDLFKDIPEKLNYQIDKFLKDLMARDGKTFKYMR